MALNKNPLLDDEFLKELYRHREKEIFAKIVALTLDNDPIEEIQGQVTGGSVSLDGSSSVRRTCNLTLVAKDLNINQYYWGLKTKFRLYIGLRNIIGWDYDDIIWFPMGTYVISNFATSQSVNSYTISITGKDKMCLLNGELSGSLFASVDFGKEEYYKDGITTISYIPIKNIIREAVHAYANETWENIIVNDLDDYGVELLDYNSDDPMYLLFRINADDNTKDCYQSLFNGETKVYPAKLRNDHYVLSEVFTVIEGETVEVDSEEGIPIGSIPNYMNEKGNSFNYDPRIELDLGGVESITATKFFLSDMNENGENIINYDYIYTIVKVENGQTCGYRLTDITYPGDLVLSVGEPITAMLDKLVGMLGNFEYFYDVDGRFIFQRKNTFVDKTWNNIRTGNQNSYVTTSDETYAEAAAYATPITWTFGDSFLITSYSNTPSLSNVKNDFSIWGTKASVTGSELPVHLRYAVDKKPTYYKTFDGVEWTTEVGDWWTKSGEGIIDTSYEELAEIVKEEVKEKIRKKIKRDAETFELKHEAVGGLQKPVKNADGSWSAGWWDIRDWHDYYVALTGQEPRRTMKWYSYNSREGCVSSKEIYDQLVGTNYTYNQSSENRYVWLLTISPSGVVNDGHGGRIINDWANNTVDYFIEHPRSGNNVSNCYYSYLNDEEVPEELINSSTNVISENEFKSYKTNEENIFIYPYWGCSDNHTYYYFLHGRGDSIDNGYSVYFYSPHFPAMSSDETFEEFIEEEVNRQLTKEKIMETLEENGYHHIVRKAENLCDWREIIFQMALDYRKHNHDDDFYLKLRTNNGLDLNNQWYYPGGKTGYEQYYVDMEGFWRQLYCPPQLMKTLYPSGVWTERDTSGGWYTSGAISADSENGIYFSTSTGITYSINVSYDDWEKEQWVNSWIENQDINDGWNKQVIESPETLNFWFDFLEADESTDLVKYSVPAIGDRAKSVNDNAVKAIYFRETPRAIYTTNIATVDRKSGYVYLQYNQEFANIFNVSSQGKSAYDVMEEYINLYLYCIESISINSIPIYHLQPNTRVMVYDENSKINGEYLVNRITIPLTFNGTMSISAIKSAEIIY